jgi:hypothetical protein
MWTAEKTCCADTQVHVHALHDWVAFSDPKPFTTKMMMMVMMMMNRSPAILFIASITTVRLSI